MENLTVRYINLDFFLKGKKRETINGFQQESDVRSTCLGKSSLLATQRSVLEGIQGETLESG